MSGRDRHEAQPMTLWYRALHPIARWGVNRVVRVQVEGAEHIPPFGPAILVPNHQSFLDPIVVQANCPRAVDSMTKSTQFQKAFFRWIIPRLHAFPVRRYRVDPQAVRVLLRRLEAGRIVCVYPEGERSWDGTLQPFRRGTLRVLLRAGVPIIPVGIDGSFDVLPRWGKRVRRDRTVHIRFGRPLLLGEHRDREKRESAVPELDRRLRKELLVLSGQVDLAHEAEEAEEQISRRGGGGARST